MSSTGNLKEEIAEWIVRIGKERVLLWSIDVKIKKEDPFINMLKKGFQASGLGEDYALYNVEYLKFRARNAKKHLYDYLIEQKNKGCLDKLLEKDLNLGPNSVSAVKGLLDLETKYNLRKYPKNIDMNALYNDLIKIKGIGEYLGHYIIYDLVRLFGFKAPKNLGPSKIVLKKLAVFDLKKNIFDPEDWPYVDAAVWDLKL